MATAFALRSLPVRRSTPRDNSCMLLQTSGMKTGQRGSRKPHRQLSQHAARAFSRSSAYAPFFDWRPIRVAYDPREPYLLAPQRKIGNQPQRDTCYIQANLVVLRDIASRVAQSTINVQRYNLAPFIQIADALVSRLGGVRRAWHVLSVLSLVLKGL